MVKEMQKKSQTSDKYSKICSKRDFSYVETKFCIAFNQMQNLVIIYNLCCVSIIVNLLLEVIDEKVDKKFFL